MDAIPLSGYIYFIVLLLVFLNGFFVASEFSIIRIRSTKVEQLVSDKVKFSKYLKRITDDLDRHLAATQLGITLVSIGIGAVAEPSVSKLFSFLFSHLFSQHLFIFHLLSYILSFSLLTYFQIVFGEQLPKIISIEKTVKIALFIAPILYFFCKIMTLPILWIYRTTELFLRLFHVQRTQEVDSHSEDEIKLIVTNSKELEPDEQKLITNVFTFNDRFVREIMTHRKDMECLFMDDPIEESLSTISQNTYSRYPLCGEDKDDILGYIYTQDLKDNITSLSDYVRVVPKIFETSTLPKALKILRNRKNHMAIVTDEYGGVSGLVTIEDILEEIVGEINDELDEDFYKFIPTPNGIIIDGSVLIDEVENELQIFLKEVDGVDTLAGYFLSQAEKKPELGDFILVGNYKIIIHKMVNDFIETLRVEKIVKNDER